MKTVILAGGQGTRLREVSEDLPKPMVRVGGRPLLWHLLQSYRHHGFREFVICLGFAGDKIREYFLSYAGRNHDFTVSYGGHGGINYHNGTAQFDEDFDKVTLAETGLNAMTGARLKKVERYIEDETFLMTYGDGLCDINLKELVRFHLSHGKIGTVTAVSAPGRFGELVVDEDSCLVQHFHEKPSGNMRISGGFFVFNRRIFDCLPSGIDNLVLENEPMENLAECGELVAYRHDGFWQCCDTPKDLAGLNAMWDGGKAPWKTWA